MAQNPDFQSILHEAIKKAIQDTVDEAKERVIKVAVEMFEKEVRHSVSRVTVEALSHYSMERLGSELLIRVKIGD